MEHRKGRGTAMGKRPAELLFFKDILSDTLLQMATCTARGVWLNLLCHMWELGGQGRLTGTRAELMRLANATPAEFDAFLVEARRLKFCDVRMEGSRCVRRGAPADNGALTDPSRADNEKITGNSQDNNGKITVINRRMDRERKSREANRLRQVRHKSQRRNNGKVTGDSHADEAMERGRIAGGDNADNNGTITPYFAFATDPESPPIVPPTGDGESAGVGSGDTGADGLTAVQREGVAVMKHLAEVTGRAWGLPPATLRLLERGVSAAEMIRVIDVKRADPYFRKRPNLMDPRVLFDPEKFESYRTQRVEDFAAEEEASGTGGGPGLPDAAEVVRRNREGV